MPTVQDSPVLCALCETQLNTPTPPNFTLLFIVIMSNSYKIRNLILLVLAFCLPDNLLAQSKNEPQQLISSSKADTWVATDDLGRKVATGTQNGTIRKDKYAGIFYFIWQGAHGYNEHEAGKRADEGVIEKDAATMVSPYDITKLLAANPKNPKYGPIHAFHHWGEPYFGYYLPDDEWVIRKHAQILSDADVDVIILDVTNSADNSPADGNAMHWLDKGDAAPNARFGYRYVFIPK